MVQSRFSRGPAGPGTRLTCTACPISWGGVFPRTPPGWGLCPFLLSPRRAGEAPGASTPHRLASLRVAGISCSLPGRCRGVSPTIRCVPPALVSALVPALCEQGVPAAPTQRVGLLGAPCSLQRRAVGTPWGCRGLRCGPCGRPGWREKPASPSSCGRTRETPASGSAGSGKRGARSFWGPGAIPGPRRRRPSRSSRPSHALFGLCGVCVLCSGSLSVLDSVSLSAPTSTPVPSPISTRGRPGAAAAAGRLRGRGGGSSQEAGLVVIFGYLAV